MAGVLAHTEGQNTDTTTHDNQRCLCYRCYSPLAAWILPWHLILWAFDWSLVLESLIQTRDAHISLPQASIKSAIILNSLEVAPCLCLLQRQQRMATFSSVYPFDVLTLSIDGELSLNLLSFLNPTSSFLPQHSQLGFRASRFIK